MTRYGNDEPEEEREDWAAESKGWEDDEEGFDEEGFANDDAETIACPYCGVEIYEESQRCPHCEKYISKEDAPAAKKPSWVVLGFILALLATALFALAVKFC